MQQNRPPRRPMQQAYVPPGARRKQQNEIINNDTSISLTQYTQNFASALRQCAITGSWHNFGDVGEF
jgi:hypothetical protein